MTLKGVFIICMRGSGYVLEGRRGRRKRRPGEWEKGEKMEKGEGRIGKEGEEGGRKEEKTGREGGNWKEERGGVEKRWWIRGKRGKEEGKVQGGGKSNSRLVLLFAPQLCILFCNESNI